MSWNLTQPEEIERAMTEMLVQEGREGAPNYSLDFMPAPTNEKPEFNRNCYQPGEPS
jgi:hypothetical protein